MSKETNPLNSSFLLERKGDGVNSLNLNSEKDRREGGTKKEIRAKKEALIFSPLHLWGPRGCQLPSTVGEKKSRTGLFLSYQEGGKRRLRLFTRKGGKNFRLHRF